MAQTQEILDFIRDHSNDKINKFPWFESVLRHNRLICYFQPIVDSNKNLFAYEAFVRAKLENGEIASGKEVMQAIEALQLEHTLDKFLHRLAIHEFAKRKINCKLSINFIGGFIQRPEKYLQGLVAAVKKNKLDAKKIIIDISRAEDLINIDQLEKIAQFCYEKGYDIALDDIRTVKQLEEILMAFTPDFIKIDNQLSNNIEDPIIFERVKEIINMAHERKVKIIIEGIEDKKTFSSFEKLKADYFQGYYIGKPKAKI